MANNNLPAHDFAPAWLKIPSYDCHKPSGALDHHHTSRKDDHHWLTRRGGGAGDDAPTSRYPFADSRWEPKMGGSNAGGVGGQEHRKTSFFPSRHQSIDIDDGQYSSSSSSSGGGNNAALPVGGSGTSSSLSNLVRRPNSRHDFREAKVNHYNHHHNNGEVNSNGKLGGKEHHRGNNGMIGGAAVDATSNNFNQEFPSLKGNVDETKADSPCSLNGSVWENPRNAKVHGVIRSKVQLVRKSLADKEMCRSKSPLGLNGAPSCVSPQLTTNSVTHHKPNAINNSANMTIFRALIPAKRQQQATPICGLMNNHHQNHHPLPTANMEILVKNPKIRGGNKSEFLKALRSEAGKNNGMTNGGEDNQQRSKENDMMGQQDDDNEINDPTSTPYENGIDINKLAVDDDGDYESNKPMLSSSLEAEQRLLREMGWKEDDGSDDDTYAPLTEDELKEFKVLSEKVGQKKNGLQPHQQHRNLQLNWSPKRVPPFTSVILPPTENWSSSSDSDSDLD